jgi:hypothetical protein
MNSKRTWTLLVGVGVAVLTGTVLWVWQEDWAQEPRQKLLSRNTDPMRPPKPNWESAISKNEKESFSTNSIDDGASPQQPATANGENSRGTDGVSRPTLEHPPRSADVRKEAARQPHSTPQALLTFAEELSVSMQGAFNDPATRYEVSRQLIACARDGQSKGTAQAARALCLYNLGRLKERYPEELTPSYQSLLAELPEDLIFVSGVSKNNGEELK